VNLFENLTKDEEWWLGYKLGFPFECLCLCYELLVRDGRIVLNFVKGDEDRKKLEVLLHEDCVMA